MNSIAKNDWWLVAGAWAVVIFGLSGPHYSAAMSQGLISQVLGWIAIPLQPQALGLLNVFLRKCLHLSEYAVLAVLLYNSLKPPEDSSWSGKAALWAVVISACYSLTDEFHQSFVPGRHASVFDCLIDTTGACLGLILQSSALGTIQPMLPRD